MEYKYSRVIAKAPHIPLCLQNVPDSSHPAPGSVWESPLESTLGAWLRLTLILGASPELDVRDVTPDDWMTRR